MPYMLSIRPISKPLCAQRHSGSHLKGENDDRFKLTHANNQDNRMQHITSKEDAFKIKLIIAYHPTSNHRRRHN